MQSIHTFEFCLQKTITKKSAHANINFQIWQCDKKL